MARFASPKRPIFTPIARSTAKCRLTMPREMWEALRRPAGGRMKSPTPSMSSLTTI